MKAKIDTIINRNRSKLQEVIPFTTPYLIYIDRSNLCNFKCKFCSIQKSITDIWNGETLKKFWVDTLKGNKNNYEMCRKCSHPSCDYVDGIDEYTEDILKRL